MVRTRQLAVNNDYLLGLFVIVNWNFFVISLLEFGIYLSKYIILYMLTLLILA
jgi:hypothetical protein